MSEEDQLYAMFLNESALIEYDEEVELEEEPAPPDENPVKITEFDLEEEFLRLQREHWEKTRTEAVENDIETIEPMEIDDNLRQFEHNMEQEILQENQSHNQMGINFMDNTQEEMDYLKKDVLWSQGQNYDDDEKEEAEVKDDEEVPINELLLGEEYNSNHIFLQTLEGDPYRFLWRYFFKKSLIEEKNIYFAKSLKLKKKKT